MSRKLLRYDMSGISADTSRLAGVDEEVKKAL